MARTKKKPTAVVSQTKECTTITEVHAKMVAQGLNSLSQRERDICLKPLHPTLGRMLPSADGRCSGVKSRITLG